MELFIQVAEFTLSFSAQSLIVSALDPPAINGRQGIKQRVFNTVAENSLSCFEVTIR